MAHYIDKDALVAEIGRRYETNLICAHSAFKNGKIEALREVKDFLDTLEVKEVDLNEEVERFAKECGYKSAATIDFQFAKHFFELGLKVAQKGE